ncbi:hypothetical protein TNIN_180951 [Trichonephila inaurata madagascariensis]|uniref:Uncharacterized protein n=1 Tax=Trichonephila inaurata madagascariensis TaxID=2747483 RepID=A0A8X6K9I9_9ARAC|nr:hypothetical protein TNIN_180951 [Trichonephila inaurata madagascariensis]
MNFEIKRFFKKKGVEKVTFQHRLRDDCSVSQAELLCIKLAMKLIKDTLHQGGTLYFLIYTDSLSSIPILRNIPSTENLLWRFRPYCTTSKIVHPLFLCSGPELKFRQ